MLSKLITVALAAAVLTAVAAPAETFNSYLWDQMKAPSSRTRAEVQAEVLQDRQGATPVSPKTSYTSVTKQQEPSAPKAEQVKVSRP